jgi:branched-chain amino acid transport system permease protein
MQFWILQTLNSLSFGALLFLLASGFSLIFGLIRTANLSHGAFFMLGAYLGVMVFRQTQSLWLACLVSAVVMAVLGALIERFLIRRLAGNSLYQVLATLGMSFILADMCLVIWGGDPLPLPTPDLLKTPVLILGIRFPAYRLFLIGVASVVALGLHVLMDRTRLGAMIRAGVDDMPMARAVGIPVSRLLTIVFSLGAALSGVGGVLGGPILSAYPGLDADMLPLALIVVILGGVGSLLGAFVGSFVIGFIYTFGTALLPDLAYVILFLPMVLVIAFRPRGLFGRFAV